VDVSLHGRPFDASALPSPSLTDEALDINAAARGGAVEFKGGLDGLVTSMSEPQHVAWCRLFGALAGNATNALAVPAGAPVRVITLGGSMLSGVGCHDYVHPTHSPLCAYPTKLVRWLGHHYGVRVELDNLAMGGMSSGAALASLPLLLRAYESSAAARNTPTLALIDFSVNDAWEDAPTSAREAARVVQRLTASTELLVRFILERHPHMALMLVSAYPGVDAAHPNPSGQASRAVAAAYGLAHVRYGNVVRGGAWLNAWGKGCASPVNAIDEATPTSFDRAPDSTRGERAAACPAHPRFWVHRLVADIAFLSVTALGRRMTCARGDPRRLHDEPCARRALRPGVPRPLLRAPISAVSVLSSLSACESPLSSFAAAARASDGRDLAPRATAGHFALYEDRPGKPGWITLGPVGSSLDFPLRFGSRPRAVVSYLRGYTAEWGVLEIEMLDARDQHGRPVRRPGSVGAHLPAWRINRPRFSTRREDGVNTTTTATILLEVDVHRCGNYACNPKKVKPGMQGHIVRVRARRAPRHAPGVRAGTPRAKADACCAARRVGMGAPTKQQRDYAHQACVREATMPLSRLGCGRHL
jgi:lysophospholipase L1-like esterase